MDKTQQGKIKAIVFDLDDTLHPTRDFIEERFLMISKFLHEKYQLENVFDDLIKGWEEKTSKYPYLFDDFCEKNNLEKNVVNELVEILNSNKPFNAVLSDEVRGVLDFLKTNEFKLGLITDGNQKRQESKVKSLKLNKWFNKVIYAEPLGGKTSEKPFMAILKALSVDPCEVIVVGDDPINDLKYPKNLGATCIRIFGEDFQNVKNNMFTDYSINSLTELTLLLKNKN